MLRDDIKIIQTLDPLGAKAGKNRVLLNRRRQWISDRLHSWGRNKPLRILIASQGLGAGGAERQIVRLMSRLNQLGLEAEHFYYSPSEFYKPHFIKNQVDSHFIDRDRLGQYRFWKKMVSLFRRRRYDVAHAFGGTANFYIRRAAVLAGIPVIIGGSRNRVEARSLRLRLPYSLLNYKTQAWILNAKTNVEALEKLWGMKQLNTYVVANAVDFEEEATVSGDFFDAELKAWIAGRMIVGSVGRISKQKNIDLFLDLAGKLRRLKNKVCFCHVGGTLPIWRELEKHLLKRIEQENLPGYVRLLGVSDKIAGFFSRLSVFFLPRVGKDVPMWSLRRCGPGGR